MTTLTPRTLPLVVLSVFGTEGNINSVLAVAQALRERGADALVVTHGVFAQRYGGEVPMVGVDTEKEFVDTDRMMRLLNAPHDVPTFFRQSVVPFSVAECKAIIEAARSREVVVVTTDSPGIGARVAAEALDAPLVTLFQAPGFLLSRPIYATMLDRYLRPEIEDLRAYVGITTPMPPASAWLDKSAAALALWPSWFDRARGLTSRVATKHVGFVWFERPPSSYQSQPDPGEIDVLITGGSASVSTGAFYAAAIDGCALLGREFVVITPHRALLPRTVAESSRWWPWVNLSAALSRTRCVIHHGGIGTVVDALRAGVSQIVMADGGDRPENGKIVEAIGTGHYLPKNRWHRSAVASVLNRLDTPGVPSTAATVAPSALLNGRSAAAETILNVAHAAAGLVPSIAFGDE